MNKLPGDLGSYFDELKFQLADCAGDFESIIFASFPLLPGCIDAIKARSLTFVSAGAQNCHSELNGTYTGEVSPELLRVLGATAILVGHSERRKFFFETDEFCHKKINTIVSLGLRAVLCVGETWDEKEKGLTAAVVKSQLTVALANLSESNPGDKLVVAYEPVWAISGGPGTVSRAAEASDIETTHQVIYNVLGDLGLEESTRIIYGGSANPDNIEKIMAIKHVHGVLPGAASLDPVKFAAMIRLGLGVYLG